MILSWRILYFSQSCICYIVWNYVTDVSYTVSRLSIKLLQGICSLSFFHTVFDFLKRTFCTISPPCEPFLIQWYNLFLWLLMVILRVNVIVLCKRAFLIGGAEHKAPLDHVGVGWDALWTKFVWWEDMNGNQPLYHFLVLPQFV